MKGLVGFEYNDIYCTSDTIINIMYCMIIFQNVKVISLHSNVISL